MRPFDLIKLARVREITKLHESGVYRHMQHGLLPRPVKFGRSSYWLEHEIQQVVGARIAGKSDAEIRALVAELMRARKHYADASQTAAAA